MKRDYIRCLGGLCVALVLLVGFARADGPEPFLHVPSPGAAVDPAPAPPPVPAPAPAPATAPVVTSAPPVTPTFHMELRRTGPFRTQSVLVQDGACAACGAAAVSACAPAAVVTACAPAVTYTMTTSYVAADACATAPRTRFHLIPRFRY